MLQAAYTTPELAAREGHTGSDKPRFFVIPVETLILFTAVTLREEKWRYKPRTLHLHPISGLMAISPLTNGALDAVLALPCFLIGQRVVDLR